MPRAVWNGKVVAESNATERVDGNHYFPPQSIHSDYFRKSSTQTTCGWKGIASYYTLEVNGQQNVDAAWVYEDPKQAAENIRGYVAFWKGVEVQDTAGQVTRDSGASGSCDVE